MKNYLDKRGISLVALIITIIVLIILTGAVIMTMNNGDIIGKSKEAVFKHDVATYREELVRIKMDKKLKEETGEIVVYNLSPTVLAEKKTLLPSFKDEYDNVLTIAEGDLYINMLLPIESEYYKWLQDLNVLVKWESSPITDFTFNEDKTIITGYTGPGGAIVIPQGVKQIGESAFEYASITSVKLPEGITSIGAHAFCCCFGLSSINLPDSITTIGAQAFQETSISDIKIPKGMTSIGNDTFYKSVLDTIDIPDHVTSIGNYAFEKSDYLKKITISKNVISIGMGAFFECYGLEEVILEAGSPIDINNASDWGIYDSSIIIKE